MLKPSSAEKNSTEAMLRENIGLKDGKFQQIVVHSGYFKDWILQGQKKA